MTKSKGQRLLQGLINKYGDAVIAFTYDYYATRIYTNPQDIRESKDPEEVILNEIHLSSVDEITSWGDIKRLEEIVTGRRPKMKYPVVVQESKDMYDSEEQIRRREKYKRDFQMLINNYAGVGKGFYNVYEHAVLFDDIAKLTEHSPTPKEFGMAMDNVKKRH